MLAQLYGPLGMDPNSRAVELLSYRQYLLMQVGHQREHEERFSLLRAHRAEGSYYDVFGLRKPKPQRAAEARSYKEWKEQAQERAPEFFEDINLN